MRHLLFVLIVFFIHPCFSQKVTLNGTVFSYKGDKLALLKKAQKNVSFDGALNGVKIELTGSSNNASVTTGLNGNFSLPLEAPGKFKIKISRSGYSTLELDVNYLSSSNKSRYESLFFILKQDDNSSSTIGQLTLENDVLSYSNASAKGDLLESNAHLIEKAVAINKMGGAPTVNSSVKSDIKNNNSTTIKIISDTVEVAAPSEENPEIKNKMLSIFQIDPNADPSTLKSKLDEAKALLETLPVDSYDYKLLKQQIEIAEQKIKDKEAIISLKENEIKQANTIMIYLGVVAVLAALTALLYIYFFRQKKRHAALLKEKNENIQRINNRLMSSIRYASLIQNGFMQDKANLKKLFADAFVYFNPKDVLSGDFYWFAHINNHKIVVVADCTGHGVPGAMLTVLGHSILDDVVLAKGETSPVKILHALNKGLVKTFSDNKHNLEFGMDITVLSVKDGSDEMVVSGVNNGLYSWRRGEKSFHAVPPVSLGADLNENELSEQRIKFNPGDTFFLFTDGFADQFRYVDNKPVKFNIKRFESLLEEIAKNNSIGSAESRLAKAFDEWKQNADQLDDVCVVGIRI